MSDGDCMVAIFNDGTMRAAVCITENKSLHTEAVAEWAADKRVVQILRVPVEIPRKFLFEQWPGLEAATAAVAAEIKP